MPLYKKVQTAKKFHGQCQSPDCQHPQGKDILTGMRYALLSDFNPRTRQPGGTWKRHEDCPPLAMEPARLSDQRRR